jgi:Phospholipase_D-nuclease N-terminal
MLFHGVSQSVVAESPRAKTRRGRSRRRSRGSSAALLYGWPVFGRILIAAVVVLFLVLWVRAVIDVFRRGDLSGPQKAAWAIIMLVVPFIGLLVYTLMRPSDAQIAQRSPR